MSELARVEMDAERKKRERWEADSAIFFQICDQIMDGSSLSEICKERGVNSRRFRQMMYLDGDLARYYDIAQKIRADILFDEILETAKEAKDRDSAAAVREKLAATKFVLSKLNPKKYMERTVVEHDVSKLTDDELLSRVRGIENAVGIGGRATERGRSGAVGGDGSAWSFPESEQ